MHSCQNALRQRHIDVADPNCVPNPEKQPGSPAPFEGVIGFAPTVGVTWCGDITSSSEVLRRARLEALVKTSQSKAARRSFCFAFELPKSSSPTVFLTGLLADLKDMVANWHFLWFVKETGLWVYVNLSVAWT